MNPSMFGHANLEAIRTQFIARIDQQAGPAGEEVVHAFYQHFPSFKGMLFELQVITHSTLY